MQMSIQDMQTQPPWAFDPSSDPKTDTFVRSLMNWTLPLSNSGSEDSLGIHAPDSDVC